MTRPGSYPAELRERAVRMVSEHRQEYPSEWAAIKSIAEKLGVHHETVRIWVRRAQINTRETGLTTQERERLVELERENRELRWANEILMSASVFFATELDARRAR